ncbi:hypothetical protein AVEN_25752-1 [Araneus ventricosus]|uniref:Uncharacterized protein n=1 Tax=Araneus ventricosus TaxID=182803 RepID=A0A4Y2NUT2_ARAVE|nr:hypothetical protein AVEN_25752-1 [Araneus ventricosus]
MKDIHFVSLTLDLLLRKMGGKKEQKNHMLKNNTGNHIGITIPFPDLGFAEEAVNIGLLSVRLGECSDRSINVGKQVAECDSRWAGLGAESWERVRGADPSHHAATLRPQLAPALQRALSRSCLHWDGRKETPDASDATSAQIEWQIALRIPLLAADIFIKVISPNKQSIFFFRLPSSEENLRLNIIF